MLLPAIILMVHFSYITIHTKHLKLRTNGTKAGTDLSADNQPIVDAFMIAGVGLDNADRNKVQNIVNGIIGSATNGNVQAGTLSNSNSISLTTQDLKTGKYILSVGIWSNSPGNRLVGLIKKKYK